jgi:hypothetical protein
MRARLREAAEDALLLGVRWAIVAAIVVAAVLGTARLWLSHDAQIAVWAQHGEQAYQALLAARQAQQAPEQAPKKE